VEGLREDAKLGGPEFHLRTCPVAVQKAAVRILEIDIVQADFSGLGKIGIVDV
jgi:hypothetical protein